MLAYSLESDEPWALLGIPWEEGPIPDIHMIERRCKLAHEIATLC